MSSLPAVPQQAAPARPARLDSEQLRELSRQWHQRVDEDPEKIRRVTAVLDWLATQREAPPPSPVHGLRPAWWQGLALLWRTRLSRLSRLHLAR